MNDSRQLSAQTDCNRVRAALRDMLAWVDAVEAEQRELAALKMVPQRDPNAPEAYIDSAQAAELLGQHVHTVIRWAREGKIPADRFGKEWRFLASELRAWAEDQRRRRNVRAVA